ncbi:MAG TPA: immunoglobulin domain-containing protein, partial [Patescibacteria group bacterium]|nr:immunoglobulin domain-containing protein [Patescibacteria group bacterium]
TPTEGASYQWYRNGVALTDDARISGSRSSVLTISDIRSTDTSATYYAQVTGVCGTAQSNTARIYIAGITLATAPQSVEVCTGGNATMNVVATPSIGGSTMTYQWMKDGVAMQDGGRVSGSRTSTLTITGVTSSDVSSNYTVMVTSQPGNVRLTSPAAGVSLKAATAISQQPQSREVCQGSPLDLGVTATGSGLSYEWRLNGQAVSGATSSTYAPSATPEMSGEYTVIVRGECGEVSSETVTVTVNQQTAITQQPVATLSQNQFNTLTLSVAATGTGTLSYQWYKDGNAISGATTATYTKANSSPTDAGRYYVEVTGTCGMVRSSETTVEITTSVADIPQAGYSVEATQPNPVMEEGRISFTLGRSEMTTVTITDMFGREVAVLASMFMTEGHHTVSFSASGLNLASGSYIYTVATPTFRATRQLLIVR